MSPRPDRRSDSRPDRGSRRPGGGPPNRAGSRPGSRPSGGSSFRPGGSLRPRWGARAEGGEGSDRFGADRPGSDRLGGQRQGGEWIPRDRSPRPSAPGAAGSAGVSGGGDRRSFDRRPPDRAAGRGRLDRFDRPERRGAPSARPAGVERRPFGGAPGGGPGGDRDRRPRPSFGRSPQGRPVGGRPPLGRPSFAAPRGAYVPGPSGGNGAPESENYAAAAPSDLIWGRHSAQATLESGRPIHRIWCTPEMRFSPKFLQLLRDAKASGVLVEEVTWARLGQISGGAVHQGIVLQPAAAETLDLPTLIDGCRTIGESPLLIAVDGLTDPQNLGAIVRSAESLGAHGMVLPQRRNAGLTGSVAKVAAGALEHLPVARVVNLNRSLDTLKQEGYRIIGLAAEGTVSLEEVDLDGPLVIVTGSEGDGLSMLTRRNCDQLVRIPLRGATPSLNASVATALLLYEVARRGWMRGLGGSSPAPRIVRPTLPAPVPDLAVATPGENSSHDAPQGSPGGASDGIGDDPPDNALNETFSDSPEAQSLTTLEAEAEPAAGSEALLLQEVADPLLQQAPQDATEHRWHAQNAAETSGFDCDIRL